MSRALVGRGVPFSRAIERRGGGVHFCDGKKGGTIFPFCVFIPTGGHSLRVIMDYTKRLRPTGVPFSGWRYIKG